MTKATGAGRGSKSGHHTNVENYRPPLEVRRLYAGRCVSGAWREDRCERQAHGAPLAVGERYEGLCIGHALGYARADQEAGSTYWADVAADWLEAEKADA